jgi:hypothetical protein
VSATRNKPHRPVAFNVWYSRFQRLANNDSEASSILSRAAFYGEAQPVLLLLHWYVTGAPTGPQIKAHLKTAAGGDLADQMEKLANAIKEFDAGKAGPKFRHSLKELSTLIAAWAPCGAIAESYDRLPQLLSTLAVTLRYGSLQSPSLSPPGRKKIQSRALALLYLHISSFRRQSDYSIALELATLLRLAYQATKLREDAMHEEQGTHEEVSKRIRRFRQKDPEEFALFNQIVENGGIADRKLLRLVLMFPLPFHSR